MPRGRVEKFYFGYEKVPSAHRFSIRFVKINDDTTNKY